MCVCVCVLMSDVENVFLFLEFISIITSFTVKKRNSGKKLMSFLIFYIKKLSVCHVKFNRLKITLFHPPLHQPSLPTPFLHSYLYLRKIKTNFFSRFFFFLSCLILFPFLIKWFPAMRWIFERVGGCMCVYEWVCLWSTEDNFSAGKLSIWMCLFYVFFIFSTQSTRKEGK